MAFAYRGGGYGKSNTGGLGGSTVDVTPSVTPNDGDLVVAYLNINGPQTFTSDQSGWTEAENEVNPGSQTCRHALLWRIASSEPSSYGWALGASDRAIAVVHIWSSDTDAEVDLAAVTDINSAFVDISASAADGRSISANGLSVIGGGKDNYYASSGGVEYTTANNSYGDVEGHTDPQMTAVASRIYGGTGGSISGNVTITPTTGSDTQNDNTYSIHMSFVESAGGGGATVSPNDVAQLQAIDAPSITQTHTLAPGEVAQLQAIDAPTVSSDHQVTPNEVDQVQAIDAPSITQDHQLNPGEVAQLQVIDAPTISVTGSVSPVEVAQLQFIGGVTITQDHQLAPGDVNQLQVIDAPTAGETAQLSPVDVAQLQAVDAVAISIEHTLSPSDVAQIQALDGVVLSQDHQLTPADLVQLQIIGGAGVAIPTGYIPTGRALIIAPRARALAIVKRLRAITVKR